MQITLTGIDSKTDLSKLKKTNIYDIENRIEYGILLSANPKSNRYPSIEQIREMVSIIDPHVSIAIHICGGEARKRALAGEYRDILTNCNVYRVQVNGKVTEQELMDFCDEYVYSTIITQDCPANMELWRVERRNHSILLDASGGRGIVRSNWDIPEHLRAVAESGKKKIGFAGGLGEDNLAEVVPLISREPPLHPWVDMETKLRNSEDWFDIEVAHRCAALVERKI